MMNSRKFVERYIEKINKELGADVTPNIKEATVRRYPLYSNCIDRAFYINDDLFDALPDEQKESLICYSYSLLLDADISTRNKDMIPGDSIRLVIDPSKLTRIVCKLMGIEYYSFDEIQVDIYRQRKVNRASLESSFYKKGDLIRVGPLLRYQVDDVYLESDEIMIKAHAINYHDNNKTKILIKPETEMVGIYRIISPAEA